MQKKDIVAKIGTDFKLNAKEARSLVNSVLTAIIDGCIADGEVVLRRFGTFKVKEQKSRRVKVPRSGDVCDIPARKVVKFRSSRTFEL